MSSHQQKSLHTLHQDLLSAVISIVINGLIFSGFVAMGYQNEIEPEPTEEVQWVALTALGEVMPKALPRIVAPDEAPIQTSKAISISRVKEEKPVEKEKKVKEIEKKPKPKPKPKAKTKKRSKRKRKPKKGSLESLFSRDDERADRGKRRGDKRGHSSGTSTTWNESTAMSIYINRVRTMVARRFKPPSTLSKRKLKKLSAKIYIKINRQGRIVGEPKWKQKSNNKFFDNASIRALDPFLVDKGVARLPLPKDKTLRKEVLRRGFDFVLAGKDM